MTASKGMLIGLGLSVALNLFLIGAGAGVLGFAAKMAHERPAPRAAMRAAAASLDGQQRAAFVRMLRQEGRKVRAANAQARALRLQAWEGLNASTFDPEGAKALLARARAINLASRTEVEDATMAFAAGLPAGQRASFGAAVRGAIVAAGPVAAPPPAPKGG
ncbi:MAG TPA: periplasmic heavy metal sensor [Caulobacteraceae bacterium]